MEAGLGGQSAPPSLKQVAASNQLERGVSRGAVRPPFIEARLLLRLLRCRYMSRGAVRPPFIEAEDSAV